MARQRDKERAITLRLKGQSYSQIKEELGVGKSTLSNWLKDYPLSEERIRELRDFNPRRIERCRNTKARKKQARQDTVFERVKKEIGDISDREMLVAGLVLYWGEGLKTTVATSGIANTDPAMIQFYLKWLKLMGVSDEKIAVRLQLYSDMNKSDAIRFWRIQTRLPQKCFRKVYVKKSRLSDLTYKNGFGHGTCNVIVYGRDIKEYIDASLRYLREDVSVWRK